MKQIKKHMAQIEALLKPPLHENRPSLLKIIHNASEGITISITITIHNNNNSSSNHNNNNNNNSNNNNNDYNDNSNTSQQHN